MARGKRDGRREARWRRIVAEWGRSGLTIREFCRRSKLTETAFYFWRRELERREAEQADGVVSAESEGQRGGSGGAAEAAFVPVRVAEEASREAGRIEIVLLGGRRVRVAGPVDCEALADVLAVLAGVAEARDGEGGRC